MWLISLVVLLGCLSAALAEDLYPPDFAGGEQTGVVFWEFLDSGDQPTSVSYDPAFIYTPELDDPEFGYRYSPDTWEWQAEAGMNGDGAMLFTEEESLVQPVPEGDGENLTVYVQMTLQEGDGFEGLGIEIEAWEGFDTGYGGGAFELIDEHDLGDGWIQTIFATTLPADGVGFVHIICHMDVGGEYLVDQVIVDMVLHDGDDPPEGPGRVGGEPGLASGPNPGEGASFVARDTVLSWTAGEFAASHNVYFGMDFDEVNEADTDSPLLVSSEQADSTWAPGELLDWGQEYAWRIDEINSADPNGPWKGNTWSFTVEPYAYALDPEADQYQFADYEVEIHASSVAHEDIWADATVWDGVEDGIQNTEVWTMWLSDVEPEETAWIVFPFDKAYVLTEMEIWNYNEDVEPDLGFGFKTTVIEYTTDDLTGEDVTWTELMTVDLNPAPGEDTPATDTLGLQNTLASALRLTAKSNQSEFNDQFGLSSVRIHYLPVRAFDLEPEPEAEVDVEGLELVWRAGRLAATHEVYLGTDEEELALVATTTETSYAPDNLALGTEYFWRIDEVNEAEDPASWEGEALSFITAGYLTVDNFEDYDDDCERIFFTWQDGFGHGGSDDCGVPASNGNGTGSIVGNAEAPFAEQDIVHDDSDQSMPLAYDNTGGVTMSEATRQFDEAQDWTRSNAQALTLYVHGSEDNLGGQMYVKINSARVDVDVDLAEESWQEVNIDLAGVTGTNLQSVTSLTLGIEGAGNLGTVYVDNIRLYPSRCIAEYAPEGDLNGDCVVDEDDLDIVTQALEAAGAAPIAEFRFDDLSDSAGTYNLINNGGMLEDGVLVLDGASTVEIPFGARNPFDGSSSYTLVMDFKTEDSAILFSSARDNTPDNHAMSVFVGVDEGTAWLDHFWVGGASAGPDVRDDEWHTLGVIWDMETGRFTLYLDGEASEDEFDWFVEDDGLIIPNSEEDTVLIGGSQNLEFPGGDAAEFNNFIGSIDNVRIYDVAAAGLMIQADANGDGIVDQADLDLVEANQGVEAMWP